jgi:hypothetical protein
MYFHDIEIPAEVIGMIIHYVVSAGICDAWKLRGTCSKSLADVITGMKHANNSQRHFVTPFRTTLSFIKPKMSSTKAVG